MDIEQFLNQVGIGEQAGLLSVAHILRASPIASSLPSAIASATFRFTAYKSMTKQSFIVMDQSVEQIRVAIKRIATSSSPAVVAFVSLQPRHLVEELKLIVNLVESGLVSKIFFAGPSFTYRDGNILQELWDNFRKNVHFVEVGACTLSIWRRDDRFSRYLLGASRHLGNALEIVITADPLLDDLCSRLHALHEEYTEPVKMASFINDNLSSFLRLITASLSSFDACMLIRATEYVDKHDDMGNQWIASVLPLIGKGALSKHVIPIYALQRTIWYLIGGPNEIKVLLPERTKLSAAIKGAEGNAFEMLIAINEDPDKVHEWVTRSAMFFS